MSACLHAGARPRRPRPARPRADQTRRELLGPCPAVLRASRHAEWTWLHPRMSDSVSAAGTPPAATRRAGVAVASSKLAHPGDGEVAGAARTSPSLQGPTTVPSLPPAAAWLGLDPGPHECLSLLVHEVHVASLKPARKQPSVGVLHQPRELLPRIQGAVAGLLRNPSTSAAPRCSADPARISRRRSRTRSPARCRCSPPGPSRSDRARKRGHIQATSEFGNPPRCLSRYPWSPPRSPSDRSVQVRWG